MLKKKKIVSIIKEKKFYISLGVGIAAIFGIFSLNFIPATKNNNLVDLNEPSATDEPKEHSLSEINKPKEYVEMDNSTLEETNDEFDSILDNDALLEYDAEARLEGSIDTQDNPETTDEPAETVKPGKKKAKGNSAVTNSNQEQASQDSESDTVAVLNSDTKPLSNLKFDEEKGLLWPVNGNVILNYNAEGIVYFPTLAQYKSNPAIVIEAEVGTKVLCSTDCEVTNITNDDETGLTITTSIGNNYEVTYGQLKDITVEKGDIVKEGEVLGYVAEPTKYYVVEGSNLYYQVTEKEESVNPLLLLR